MSGERRGRERELDVVRLLRSDGFVSYRLAHGHADVIGLKAGLRPRLVQVKSTRRPWERFEPDKRLNLAVEAVAAGAIAQLCHWPTGGVPYFYDVDEWPPTLGVPVTGTVQVVA